MPADAAREVGSEVGSELDRRLGAPIDRKGMFRGAPLSGRSVR
jgi:hypothetical protein